MNFIETSLPGVFVIDLVPREDVRGFFARTFCEKAFLQRGLNPRIAQCNMSFSHLAGTLRGLHYQRSPAEEVKLVRCFAGAVWDVVVDLRKSSPTYLQHIGVELSGDNHRAIYVPAMCAHGYQTLSDGVEMFYGVSEFYMPSAEGGLRYDDPELRIPWPLPVATISSKDAGWPLIDRDWLP